MTLYVCTHHLGFAAWAIVGIILLYVMAYEYSLLNDGSYVPPQPNIYNLTQSNEDFAKQLEAHNRPIHLQENIDGLMFIFVLINLVGLFMANLRYKWIGVKDCSR